MHSPFRRFFQVPDFAEILIPFSDNMSDFDGNGDGRISYEEFVSAVERTVRLADLDELWEPFVIADVDGRLTILLVYNY